MREAVIVSAVRTAAGRALKGSLKDTRPDELAAMVIKEAVKRVSVVKPEDINDVIMGCAMPEGEQGMNVARIAMFRAGLPYTTTAMTVNRFCSSGLEAVEIAANKIMIGSADIIIAGGVESMTMVPMGGMKPSPNPALMDLYPEVYTPMGITAEIVNSKFNITREEQDRFALESHEKAINAIKAGKFKNEIVPVEAEVRIEKPDGSWEWKKIIYDVDECPRSSTLEALGKLKAVFSMTGSVTAGNSSPINDGAAAVMLMPLDLAKKLNIRPMGIVREYSVAGVPPEIMGIGPVAAVPNALQKAGLKLDDIDLFEINEAFAAQSVYCAKELNIPRNKINVNGGAIALGHPLGCTGAKILTTLLYELERRKGHYGIVTMCIGGGMGAAGIFERKDNY